MTLAVERDNFDIGCAHMVQNWLEVALYIMIFLINDIFNFRKKIQDGVLKFKIFDRH